MIKNTQKGISILGVLILGFILILVLSYLNVSIKGVVESPTGQENLNYVGETSKSFWTKYLAEPAHYLWKDVWVDIFWTSFIKNVEKLRDGEPTDLDNAAQNLKVDAQGRIN